MAAMRISEVMSDKVYTYVISSSQEEENNIIGYR
jgi:hypothetical protein